MLGSANCGSTVAMNTQGQKQPSERSCQISADFKALGSVLLFPLGVIQACCSRNIINSFLSESGLS
jgi:hypothetical protein